MTDRIVVAVPTFRRPALLATLLTDLAEQARPDDADVSVCVIDNDPDGSAADVAAAHDARYVREPARGLAAVRNRALDEAGDARALVFIDDDERPGAHWLARLVETWRDSGAAAVSGRVESRFPDGFDDPWIHAGGFFRRVAFPAGASQPAAPTNNLLLDLDAVRRSGLRFDPRFGLSGGEDILFTKQLVAAGGTIVAAPDALVFDDVAADRLTPRWVLRRAYRVGISSTRTDLVVRPGIVTRLRWLAAGLARMTAGTLRRTAGVLTRSVVHRARGARAQWRGAGMAAGALGFDYAEYRRRDGGN